eukprot:10645645-Lingulodinium_polyedra.AAC.1
MVDSSPWLSKAQNTLKQSLPRGVAEPMRARCHASSKGEVVQAGPMHTGTPNMGYKPLRTMSCICKPRAWEGAWW